MICCRWRRPVGAIAIVLGACRADSPLEAVTSPDDVPVLHQRGVPDPLTPLVQLDIPTYERSGQAVHPDVVRFASPWRGWEYWMAMTPFPQGNDAFENPSILVSHDGLKWLAPLGIRNPLAPTPHMHGYNSDPDLSYDASHDRLVLMYREVSARYNLIHSTVSSDGVHWGLPRLMFRRRNHGIVSPAMTFTPAGAPAVWYVDAGPKSCHDRVTHVSMQQAANADALVPAAPERGWSAPRRTGLAQGGYNIWHLDVTWVAERGEYWAVYVMYPGHNCWAQDLYFARSYDGLTWTTYNGPFLRHDAHAWTGSTLYRASVTYDASRDAIQFFVSGQGPDKSWRLGYVDYRLADFLPALEHASSAPVTSAPTDQSAEP